MTLSPPRWIRSATSNAVAHVLVEGSIAPKDPRQTHQFPRVAPGELESAGDPNGGGGLNGMGPMLRGDRRAR